MEQHAVFLNKELNPRPAGVLRLPEDFNLSKNYPAVAAAGPMLSVKEGPQAGCAARLKKRLCHADV